MWKILRTACKINARRFLRKPNPRFIPVCVCSIIGGGLVSYYTLKNSIIPNVSAETTNSIEENVKRSPRQRRFISFASVEFDGQLFMTPQDFLESIISLHPTPRLKPRKLTVEDVEKLKKITPPLGQGTNKLFRDLGQNGLVSYTEYLFLLSILIKPKSGFKIAFRMFDIDGNKKIDRNEFFVIEKIFSQVLQNKYEKKLQNQTIRGDEAGLQKSHVVHTTLQIHFFGPDGKGTIEYKNFKTFMENVQAEVIELEFKEYSEGKTTISQKDFAEFLLRYSHVSRGSYSYDMYLNRLKTRMKNNFKEITFEEFQMFWDFLNNFEDFTVAMRLYTVGDQPVTKTEFHHAARICTGSALSDLLIETVFAIFDNDGDGLLSYEEFIGVMKDRKHYRLTTRGVRTSWNVFIDCLRHEMVANSFHYLS